MQEVRSRSASNNASNNDLSNSDNNLSNSNSENRKRKRENIVDEATEDNDIDVDYYGSLSQKETLIYQRYKSSHVKYTSGQAWKLFQQDDYENYKQFGVAMKLNQMDVLVIFYPTKNIKLHY